MNIQELKLKSSEQLITQAEELGIENASTLRKQEILFAILKKLAQKNEQITGGGVLEVLLPGALRGLRAPLLRGRAFPDSLVVHGSHAGGGRLHPGQQVHLRHPPAGAAHEGDRSR